MGLDKPAVVARSEPVSHLRTEFEGTEFLGGFAVIPGGIAQVEVQAPPAGEIEFSGNVAHQRSPTGQVGGDMPCTVAVGHFRPHGFRFRTRLRLGFGLGLGFRLRGRFGGRVFLGGDADHGGTTQSGEYVAIHVEPYLAPFEAAKIVHAARHVGNGRVAPFCKNFLEFGGFLRIAAANSIQKAIPWIERAGIVDHRIPDTEPVFQICAGILHSFQREPGIGARIPFGRCRTADVDSGKVQERIAIGLSEKERYGINSLPVVGEVGPYIRYIDRIIYYKTISVRGCI